MTTTTPDTAIALGRSLAEAHDTETLAAALFHALLTEPRIWGATRAALRSDLARLVSELRDADRSDGR
jgi:uncharacterized protein (DUF1800 family)